MHPLWNKPEVQDMREICTIHHSSRPEEEYTNYCVYRNESDHKFIPAVMHTQKVNNSIYFYGIGHKVGHRVGNSNSYMSVFCQLSNYYDWLISKAGNYLF